MNALYSHTLRYDEGVGAGHEAASQVLGPRIRRLKVPFLSAKDSFRGRKATNWPTPPYTPPRIKNAFYTPGPGPKVATTTTTLI